MRNPGAADGLQTGDAVDCCLIPAKIPAGLTFDKLLTLTAFPASSWSVSLMLRGPSTIDIPGVAEGGQHRFRANAATTALWAPGVYRWALRAVREGEIFGVEDGTLTIAPDITSLADGSPVLSHARICLANIQAVLEKRSTQDQQRYVINNRELWRTPMEDLLKLRDVYLAEVRREDRALCGRNPFGPALRVRV